MSLTATQLDQFHTQGYLVLENILSETDLQALWDEYTNRLDEVAQKLYAAGRISSLCADLNFGERYVALLNEDTSVFDQLEISLPLENGEYPFGATIHTGPAVFGLLTHPHILDIVEAVIGPEIYSNPVQHFRLKPPLNQLPEAVAGNSYIGKTTWHQDQGALLDEADDSHILTVWVAITDTSTEQGCLAAVPGSHLKNGGTLTLHCPGKGITAENYIPSKLLGDSEGNKQVVPLPVGRGGVVLLNRYTEHAALPNRSNSIRWSFDLRYNPIGQATGRPAFPGFIARSKANPASVLPDAAAWTQLWETAKQRLIQGEYEGQVYNETRWAAYRDGPVCA